MFMQELSLGCKPEEAKEIELVLSGKDCTHHGVKRISETVSQAPCNISMIMLCGMDST